MGQNPDQPINDPQEDCLGYGSFASKLSDSIASQTCPSGLVIAIHGTWGQGKTSTINLVLHQLASLPETSRPLVIKFNPWWFSGYEDLTRRFFSQFQAALSGKSEKIAAARARMAEFAEVVSEAPLPHSWVAKALALVLRKRPADVPELKLRAESALSRLGKTVLVVIDDVDRLSPDEIASLFRVVKAVANFPNTAYLLAFDRRVVADALTESLHVSGTDYLEKIVQVPIELPVPERNALRAMLFGRLGKLTKDGKDVFDEGLWSKLYYDGIDPFIKTPRDAVRFANAVSFSYPPVAGEVNFSDFMAIEALRVFCPSAYGVIRANPESFVGSNGPVFGMPARDRTDSLRTFHNAWLELIAPAHREIVRRMVITLFPGIQSCWENIHWPPDWESKWRKECRICSKDTFSVYFRLAIPDGGISNSEMQAILALAGNRSVFSAKLVELAAHVREGGISDLPVFLERLEDYTAKDIPEAAIASIVLAIFDVGDQVVRPADRGNGLFELSTDLRLGRVTWQLLKRLKEPDRFDILSKAVSDGQAVGIIAREVSSFGQQHKRLAGHDPDPEAERMVNSEHLAVLERGAADRIRQLLAGDGARKVGELAYVLYRLREWGDADEVRRWVSEATRSDSEFASFIEKFVTTVRSQAMDERIVRTRRVLDPKTLEPLVDLEATYNRAKALVDNKALQPEQRGALATFVSSYDLWKQGKDFTRPDED